MFFFFLGGGEGRGGEGRGREGKGVKFNSYFPLSILDLLPQSKQRKTNNKTGLFKPKVKIKPQHTCIHAL